MAKSIRVRLQLWYAVVLTAVVGGFAGLLYYEVRSARLAEFDAQLESTAASLDAALRLFPHHELIGEPIGKHPPKKPGVPGMPGKGPEFGPGPPGRDRLLNSLDPPGPPSDRPKDVYFAVWRSDGTLIKASGVSPDRAMPAIGGGSQSQAYRGPNREFLMRGPEATTILVGRPSADFSSGLASFAWQLSGTGVAVLAIGLIGGWWTSRRIVRPIASIAATASRISADNLSERIDPQRVDNELAELANVLNGTFERLQAAFDQQTQFTADASHELRTPLAVIRSQAELALSRQRSPEEYQEALRTCLRATARMADLVDGLLTLARTDAGLAGTNRVRINLQRTIADAVDLCRSLAQEKEIRIVTELVDAKVVGDSAALSRVVTNLVVNGIQYNRSGGEVHVSLVIDDADALVSVRDTGAGIAKEHQSHLFERFYRADKARSRATGGNGLGLAIAKAVIEAHDGVIGFSSTVGEGSTFWFRLPLVEPLQRGANPKILTTAHKDS
jgi:heavy metal sensor kinase